MRKLIATVFALALALAAGQAYAKDWKKIRIGVEGAYPPFSWVEPDGTLKGFDIDIAWALCEEIGAECELVPQDCLAVIKHAADELERELAETGDFPVVRPVNIDPGLVNDCRVILASTHDYAHRIYRGAGIWEEITLIWRHGAFEAQPWTYPDFRAPTYHEFFADLRRDLLSARAPP